MLPIFWTERALEDLDEIFDYIARRNEKAANAVVDRIEQSVLPAAQFPHMFRPGKVDGTREIVAHPNYIVIYRVTQDHIEVSGVVHTSRDYPRTVTR